MATTKTSEAKARIGMDSSNFEKAAKAVMNAANAMSAAVTVAFAAASAAIIAAVGSKVVRSIIDSVKSVLDLGESMANAGKRAGTAAGQFYLFNTAIEKGLSLKTVAGLIGENAEVLNKSASIFRDVSIKLWAIGEKIRGFWLGLMERVAPVLSRILDGTLGTQLVSAGEWFGQKIADAVTIVYQLAKDGQLWNTLKTGLEIAFKYAAERVMWLGNTISAVLKAVSSAALEWGITEGINRAEKAMGEFSSNAGIDIAIAFANVFSTVVDLVDSLLERIKKAVSHLSVFGVGAAIGAAGESGASIAKQVLTSTIQALLNSKGARGGTNSESLSATIAKAIKESIPTFKPSDDLTGLIAGFTKTIGDSLTTYKADEAKNPTTSYENNTRQAAFGADSLTAIGGGGGVYLGLSVLDVNKEQLAELRAINQKLSGKTSGDTQSLTRLYSPMDGISRAQTAAPVN